MVFATIAVPGAGTMVQSATQSADQACLLAPLDDFC
jgi:hypothetical protein